MNEHGLLQEIEEDLSRKRYEALWKKFGPYVIGGAVAIVLVTALVVGLKNYNTTQEQRVTGDLLTLVQETKTNTAEKIASVEAFAADETGKPHAVLAKLQAANLAMEANDKEKALAFYNEIAMDDGLEPFFRQLGDLLVVQTNLDDGEAVALEARLEPLMKEDCAWRFSAYEYAGYLAIRLGDKAKAKTLFTELIALPNVPTDFVSRANDIVRWLEGGA